MTISVIVPTYNHAAFLPQALDSLRAQERPADEVLVVDDGSTDATAGLVARRYPTVRLLQQPNRGLAAARNRGLGEARGDLVVFLDADDWLTPDALGTKAALLERNTALGWVYSDLYLTDEAGTVTQRCSEAWRYRGRRLHGWIFEELLLGNFIPVHAVMARRAAVVDAGGFDESLPNQEDYDLWLRLARRAPVAYVDRPLGYYRIKAVRMSADRYAMAITALRIAARLEREFPREVRQRRAAWRRRQADLLLQAARHARATPARGLALVARAVRVRPVQRAAYRALFRLLMGARS
jgi:glycosyltransferase involved in cell wall biosynthesis